MRNDLASLLKNIAKCCGPMTIYSILGQYLSQAVTREGQIANNDDAVSVYLDLECLLFCITQLVRCMDTSDIGQVKDVVLLVMKLIDTTAAFPVCEKFIAMRL